MQHYYKIIYCDKGKDLYVWTYARSYRAAKAMVRHIILKNIETKWPYPNTWENYKIIKSYRMPQVSISVVNIIPSKLFRFTFWTRLYRRNYRRTF